MGQPLEVSTAAAKIPGLHLTLPGWVTCPFRSQPLGGGLGVEASIGQVQVGRRALEADNEVSFTESMGSVSCVTPPKESRAVSPAERALESKQAKGTGVRD